MAKTGDNLLENYFHIKSEISKPRSVAEFPDFYDNQRRQFTEGCVLTQLPFLMSCRNGSSPASSMRWWSSRKPATETFEYHPI